MRNALFLTVIFILNSYVVRAHKDIVVYETYGNVKVLLKTSFQYSEIDKIKIIGKLTEKLCSKLLYQDTLLVEYIHDCTNLYSKDVYKFDNDTNFEFMGGLRYESNLKKNKSGISIRINANKINIEDILNLVEYAIINREHLSEKLKYQKVIDRWGDYDQEMEFKIKSIPIELLDKIFTQESQIIQELISHKTYIVENQYIGIDIYWMNNTFTFEYKIRDKILKLIDLEDYFYYLTVHSDSMLIFISENEFYYTNPYDEKNNLLLEIKSDTYVPFEKIDYFKNKIVLFNNGNEPPNDFYILLTDKRKIISNFE